MLNFSIVPNSKQSFRFVDESSYTMRPNNPKLCVKFPSISENYNAIVRPEDSTEITTKVLNYHSNIIEFPDGIYEITYSTSSNSITKNIMWLEKAKHELCSLLQNVPLSNEEIDKYYKIDVMITAAQYHANSNPDIAMEYFNLIKKDLKKQQCHV